MTADLPRPLRAICLALPEVTERLSHGAPAWFVRGKSTFVSLWAQGGSDRWLALAGSRRRAAPTRG